MIDHRTNDSFVTNAAVVTRLTWQMGMGESHRWSELEKENDNKDNTRHERESQLGKTVEIASWGTMSTTNGTRRGYESVLFLPLLSHH